jgi:hypothetical protein
MVPLLLNPSQPAARSLSAGVTMRREITPYFWAHPDDDDRR